MCSLKVEEVQIKYDKQIIVKNISVTIAPQKITTIIGPNGCGKSTLLKAMSRILTCSSGDILLDGVSIFTMDTKRLAKRIAILLQRQENLSGITVEEIVSYGRFPHRQGLRGLGSEDKEIIDWAIKKTQIDELRHRYIDELSGGQRQRVWLAMALAQKTDIIFLDEPTTYLDISYQLEILELLKKLNEEEGYTIVMVLHDINQASLYSDHIVALADGKVVCQGAADKVITAANIASIFNIRPTIQPDAKTNKPVIIGYELINRGE